MKELTGIFEFLIDAVCMVPPIDVVEILDLPEWLPMLFSFGAVFVLAASLSVKATSNYGTNIALPIAAICILVLAFSQVDQELWKSIFVVSYPPMVISLRGAEGLLIGEALGAKGRLWHFVILIGLTLGLYFVLRDLSVDVLRAVKSGWALLGVVAASYSWTVRISRAIDGRTRSVLGGMATFVVFSSTLFYVQAADITSYLYLVVFPTCVIIAFVIRRYKIASVTTP